MADLIQQTSAEASALKQQPGTDAAAHAAGRMSAEVQASATPLDVSKASSGQLPDSLEMTNPYVAAGAVAAGARGAAGQLDGQASGGHGAGPESGAGGAGRAGGAGGDYGTAHQPNAFESNQGRPGGAHGGPGQGDNSQSAYSTQGKDNQNRQGGVTGADGGASQGAGPGGDGSASQSRGPGGDGSASQTKKTSDGNLTEKSPDRTGIQLGTTVVGEKQLPNKSGGMTGSPDVTEKKAATVTSESQTGNPDVTQKAATVTPEGQTGSPNSGNKQLPGDQGHSGEKPAQIDPGFKFPMAVQVPQTYGRQPDSAAPKPAPSIDNPAPAQQPILMIPR